MTRIILTFVLCLVAINVMSQPAIALTPEQQRFYSIYKELVNINTTNSVGDNTKAVMAMKKYLLADGFSDDEIQIFEPFPKKGNLVLRLKGDGSQKPILLLAHVDVVEAKREDWKTDPFVLQEDDEYFTARGAVDNKSMAAAFVSIVGQLKREGFQARRDLIVALTSDEEMSSVPSNGAWWLLRNHPDLINAEFGFNEGGNGQLRNGIPIIQRIQCVSRSNWTLIPPRTDQRSHGKLDSHSRPT